LQEIAYAEDPLAFGGDVKERASHSQWLDEGFSEESVPEPDSISGNPETYQEIPLISHHYPSATFFAERFCNSVHRRVPMLHPGPVCDRQWHVGTYAQICHSRDPRASLCSQRLDVVLHEQRDHDMFDIV
jgi:hypothetical protein